MDGDDDTIFNAEITMQEIETVRTDAAVDFQKYDRPGNRDERVRKNKNTNVDTGKSVIAEDLAYIMQSTFIDSVNVNNSISSSDQDEDSKSDSGDSDSDDDVRITFVKVPDENTVSDKETTIVHVISDEEEVEVIKAKNDESIHCVSQEFHIEIRENLTNSNDISEDCVVIEKMESDESAVKKLLKELVKKTAIKVLGTECNADNDQQDQLSYSGDDCLSSESESGQSTLLSILKGENQVVNHIPRVRNEVLPGELIVDIEEIVLTPKDHLNQIGVISGVVEKMVVVQSNNDAPALDGESAFFFEDQSYLGKVFDTFGPVKVPYYTVNLSRKVDASKLSVGTKVYYVPFNEQMTKYVFLEQLRKLKGSDASWRDDCEPPVACLDYSDDEEEHRVKQKSKSKDKSEKPNSNINKEQRKQAFHQRGNRFNHFHSNNQNGSTWKHGSKCINPNPGQPMLDRSINQQIMNHPSQPSRMQHPLDNQKAFLRDSNQSINLPAPTIRPILQPPFRPILQPPFRPILQPPSRPILQPPIGPIIQPPIRPIIKPPIRPVLPSPNRPVLPSPNRPVIQPPNIPMLQPPIRPMLQPPIRPMLQPPIRHVVDPPVRPILQPSAGGIESKNIGRYSIPPPMLNDFPLRRPQHNYEMNQNVQLSNGMFPFGALQNQQVTPRNHLIVRSQLPVSATPVHTQPGGPTLLYNKPSSDILSANTIFPQSFIGSSVPVANHPSKTPPIQPFGNGPPNQILTCNQNNLQSQGINNFPSNGSNLYTNNPKIFPDRSHFSMNSHQDDGIVKLNGFTFKI